MVSISSITPTFIAALNSVGTAMTMALAGFYLHRRGFVTASGKKMMALISQQVTIPAYLFSKIIACNETVAIGAVCSSVADRLVELWAILLWPFWVVLCGLGTGYLAAAASRTPAFQTCTCLAACAFSNSTGMVITLLEVISKEFGRTVMEGIDPTALLSVYLLLYPVLQWGMGGWLLAPEEKAVKGTEDGAVQTGQAAEKDSSEATPLVSRRRTERGDSWTLPNILNSEPLQTPTVMAGQEEFGGVASRRLVFSDGAHDGQQRRWYSTEKVDSSNDALHMMVKELSFTRLGDHRESLEDVTSRIRTASPRTVSPAGDRVNVAIETHSEVKNDDEPLILDTGGPATAALDSFIPTIEEHVPLAEEVQKRATSPHHDMSGGPSNGITLVPSDAQLKYMQEADILPITETLSRIVRKVLQPPVIGSLLGFFIASFPTLRGLLENIYGGNEKNAPLKCVFDGIHKVGLAAVPINMTILGINLSSTFQKKQSKQNDAENLLLPNRTMVAVVIGKMIVMPILGMLSVWFLEQYFIIFPDSIDSSCYLVMMIVFITPTANNVMVMVELSGSGSKEGMARLIGWEYVVCPVILSVVLTVVVSLATKL